MAFISARILRVIRIFSPEPLGDVDAGPNQSVLCATLVQLEATIEGDLSQHTFEWEQTAGTPVTLINPDTLTPSFENPQTTDIEFTIYTDRNTAFELSDSVLITRVPEDRPTSFGSISSREFPGGRATVKSSSTANKSLLIPDPRVGGLVYQWPPVRFNPIYSLEDLNRVRDNLQGLYWLMNDIDLSSVPNWEPIGTQKRPFTGHLFGNGFSIQNLTINDSVRNSGLFGHANNGAIIEYLGVTDANISGTTSSWYAAVLVGSAIARDGVTSDGGSLTIKNCYVTGTVDAGGDRG
ncbi:MAG: hypothetical protein WDZ68_00010, partial [Candidatus Paceibacterota bacterium]